MGRVCVPGEALCRLFEAKRDEDFQQGFFRMSLARYIGIPGVLFGAYMVVQLTSVYN